MRDNVAHPVSDDTTQTEALPPPLDPLEAQVAAFRLQPEARRFAELRQRLRDTGRGELLADVCATWAPHERDPLRAAEAWSEAGETMVVLGELETAIEYLRTALELDPTNDRATDRLLDLVEPGDPALAVEILETELAALGRATGSGTDARKPAMIARRAAQHRRTAELWNTQLGRVDRALWHFQQAWKLEPHRLEALEAARDLYAALGDDAMVAKLFGAELDVLGNDRSPVAVTRRAYVRLELGKLALRAKDYDAAASHLEEASRLEPTSLEVAEKLAEVYATPGFRSVTAGDTDWRFKASQLFVEVGRRRMERADSTGINYLRRAIGIDPTSKGGSAALETALSDSSQWQELDRTLRHRSQVVQDPAERAEILRRRAALYRNQLPDRDGLTEVLTELVGYEPPG
ncbi:MAG TPA: tetratricopeptide repeat protein, partial [Kofleriaceae bacterium]